MEQLLDLQTKRSVEIKGATKLLRTLICINHFLIGYFVVTGVKGGSSTKLTMQLCNQQNLCNSKDATNIVSMFNAVDTTANMTKVYSIYMEQLLDLQTKRTVEIEGFTKSLRTFVYSDYEALCKSLLGHMVLHHHSHVCSTN